MDRSATAIAHRLEEFATRSRKARMNVTPQRLAIYEALVRSEEHPTPEELFRVVHKKMPSTSLATIYKTLEALVKLGLVREVAQTGASKRFDGNVESHHHYVCTRCKRIVDFEDPRFDALAPSKKPRGFKSRSVSVQVLGECERCLRPQA